MLTALKELDQLYHDIENEIFRSPASQAIDEAAVSQAAQHSRQLIDRADRVNQRFSESAARWLGRQKPASREEREQVRRLAEEIRQKAARLLESCTGRSAQLEAVLSGLQKELGLVRNGARFLQSSRPARINYPKFIDSRG
jgi:hypothetical protein